MGCDIHGVFQRSSGAAWEDIESNYEQDRHYQLFAVLAGVRNGHGFAGVPTGEVITPISDPRGIPSDFVLDGDDHPITNLAYMDPRMRQYQKADEPLKIWMGEHSHSWLSGEEMVAWREFAPVVCKTGILERATYEQWDGKSWPAESCSGVSGPRIKVINDNYVEKDETPDWTHIRCHWESSLRKELDYFFDEVARLANKHGRIRFVFGFDS